LGGHLHHRLVRTNLGVFPHQHDHPDVRRVALHETPSHRDAGGITKLLESKVPNTRTSSPPPRPHAPTATPHAHHHARQQLGVTFGVRVLVRPDWLFSVSSASHDYDVSNP
jgi:hypothetical protein